MTIVPLDSFIEVTGRGFFTSADVDEHLVRLAATMTARQRIGSERVLVDLRSAAVQSPEIAERLSRGARALYAPGDRVAIVTASVLQKMQVVRLRDDAGYQLFSDRDEAEAYLRSA